jgi:hydrogenase maturation protease
MGTLVLGLGNELLADDGIGIAAARALTAELDGVADVVECNLHGIALLDVILGYEKLIIIDAVKTGNVPPGTIIELTPSDLKPVPAPSPHYAGLPELITLAGRLLLDFPQDITIFAVEIADHHTIGRPLSQPVARSLGDLVQRVKTQVHKWEEAASISTSREKPVGVP